jgi:IS5 family transposase
LSGGEAHDCPSAQRLIRRSKAAKRLLGDKAYDSAELRQWLEDRGTKPVIPNKSNRKQPFSFDKKSYKQVSVRRVTRLERVARLQTSSRATDR